MTVGWALSTERRDLDDAARRASARTFVRLDLGYTHYEALGPQDRRTIILIPGFSVPSFIWDPTFRFLAAAGFRVLRYDLYGRGFSDRPEASYGLSLYLEQLQQLLQALRIPEADLIGLSMGGPIAAAFSAAHPGSVGRLVLIDPSGAGPAHLGTLQRMLALPGIGDVLFRSVVYKHILTAPDIDFLDEDQAEALRKRFQGQMEFRGSRRAILSSVRCGMLGSFKDVYRRLGALDKLILVVWGENDRTVPFAQSVDLRKMLPQAEFFPVPGCGHVPHVERPELFNARLLEFLSER